MGCSVRDAFGNYHHTYYQDVWIQGRAVIQGGRECEIRFWAIYKALKKLKKPLKILDIGANMGYFSIRLSEKLEGCFVMVEGHEQSAQALSQICRLNKNPRLLMLKRRLCLDDLKALHEKEHFDVVLALSIIHHFEEPYNEILKVLMTLGDYLVFEPPIAEEETLNQDRIIREPLNLEGVKKKLIAEAPTGSAYSGAFLRPTYLIDCRSNSSHATLPAVSLETFREMNGFFPPPEKIVRLKDEAGLQEVSESELLLAGSKIVRRERV